MTDNATLMMQFLASAETAIKRHRELWTVSTMKMMVYAVGRVEGAVRMIDKRDDNINYRLNVIMADYESIIVMPLD